MDEEIILILQTETLSSESLFPIYTNSILHYAGSIRGLNAALNLIYVVYSGLSMRIRLEWIKVLKITNYISEKD